jgi:hypothetical protein
MSVSAPLARRIAFLMLSTAWPLAAQVSEKEEPTDLSRGLALKADTAKPGAALAEAAKTQVGSKDFSLAMTVPMPEPLRETVLAAQIDDTQGWRLLVTADGALRIEARVKGKADPFAVATSPGAVAAGSAHHVAVNIVRDAAKPNAGLWLDGIELASGIMPPSDLTASQPLSVANGARHIHLYQRSLSRPEMLALWLDAAGSGKPVAKHPELPADGPRFVPQQDETIALIGGTEAVALAESGDLEARMMLQFPDTRFHFRNLAWEGDTVLRQDRPMNFGDLDQQLRRVNASTVLVMFGRQECLDCAVGDVDRAASLAQFKASFRGLLDTVKKVTPNIVVIGAPPFESKEEPLPNLAKQNELLQQFNSIMESVSRDEKALFAPVRSYGSYPPYTDDSNHLTSNGCDWVMASVWHDLNWGRVLDYHSDVEIWTGYTAALRAKNRLWHDYWRPSNWAFLHGDRTQQPSSRDPVNPQLRFFPAEQEKYLPLIKDAEEKVYKLVEEMTKKLP